MAERLKVIRKNANLNQTEIGTKMDLKSKTAPIYSLGAGKLLIPVYEKP